MSMYKMTVYFWRSLMTAITRQLGQSGKWTVFIYHFQSPAILPEIIEAKWASTLTMKKWPYSFMAEFPRTKWTFEKNWTVITLTGLQIIALWPNNRLLLIDRLWPDFCVQNGQPRKWTVFWDHQFPLTLHLGLTERPVLSWGLISFPDWTFSILDPNLEPIGRSILNLILPTL